MNNILDSLTHFFTEVITPEGIFSVLWFLVILVIIWFTFFMLRKIAVGIAIKKCNLQCQFIVGKVIHYTGLVVLFLTVFNRLGINFSALLGAAGIIGIAIGFAAQTSVSNVISGIFVMTERTFVIGDIIQVGSEIGIVQTIDLLSIRMKTFENQLIRIPNETIIKSNLINITHYPHRRYTMSLGVRYGSDLRRIKEVLLEIADANEFALKDPAPIVMFDAFGDSAITLSFGVWTEHQNYIDIKNSLILAISDRFAEEGIIIPFHQVDVHTFKD